MYKLKVEHSFDSAHFLYGYEGKCRNIHGHRWKIEVEIKSEKLVENGQLRGMIVDFGDLKKDIKKILDYYDHALIIEKGTLKNNTLNCLLEENFKIIELEFRPTAENFSYFFYNEIKNKGYFVDKVTVYETPNNSATYEEVY